MVYNVIFHPVILLYVLAQFCLTLYMYRCRLEVSPKVLDLTPTHFVYFHKIDSQSLICFYSKRKSNLKKSVTILVFSFLLNNLALQTQILNTNQRLTFREIQHGKI
jgi:hypothetical protein